MDNNEVKKFLNDVSRILKRTLTSKEIENALRCFEMGFAAECVMYALEESKLRLGYINFRYASALAENWLRNDCKTLEEAQAFMRAAEASKKKRKNEVVLANGIRHEFTSDEILVLQLLLEAAEPLLKDKDKVTYFDERREQQILSAAASLKSLFVDHLD